MPYVCFSHPTWRQTWCTGHSRDLMDIRTVENTWRINNRKRRDYHLFINHNWHTSGRQLFCVNYLRRKLVASTFLYAAAHDWESTPKHTVETDDMWHRNNEICNIRQSDPQKHPHFHSFFHSKNFQLAVWFGPRLRLAVTGKVLVDELHTFTIFRVYLFSCVTYA